MIVGCGRRCVEPADAVHKNNLCVKDVFDRDRNYCAHIHQITPTIHK